MDAVRSLIARRRDGHWANPLLAGANDNTKALSASYDALEAAAGFFELQAVHSQGFSFASADVAFERYRSELYHLHMVELQSSGTPEALTLTSFIALCSAALGKPVQGQLAVLGDMTLGGTITQARNLAESMQVAFDAGAKRILLPMSSVTDIPSVPGELFAKFQTSFYSDPVDAVFKALGVE